MLQVQKKGVGCFEKYQVNGSPYKEIEKYQFAKRDWVFIPDINLFVRLAEKSYFIAKIILMLIPLPLLDLEFSI